ncbi:MinD/ParA family protein [Peribacillus butanolivorans]|uniref:MinD/ParA family protein n=1 Tax=Peribacillus butanolivorans TaxID=421767 RepID=UPI00368CF091
MKDQAENLRRRLETHQNQSAAKTLAILSGKGGVGKSNFSLNFSLALSKRGKKVLLFDMDIGMGNIDILIGEHSSYSIVDFFESGRSLIDIMTDGPESISIITGGTGLTSLFSLDENKFMRFNEEYSLLLTDYDYILFDMGAGITQDSAKFLLCVDELIVITTPEPTSVMDAYSTMKYIHSVKKEIPYFLVCNRVFTNKEGKETIIRLQNALKKFLGLESVALGYLPDDRTVSKAVSRQIPFILFDSEANVSKALMDIASRYTSHSFGGELNLQKSNFLSKMKRYLVGK